MSPSSSSFLFLCLYLLCPLLCRTIVNASVLQHNNCSTSDNYTATGAYAANVKIFLTALPENTVSKNGGFYNGKVGDVPDTVYGLAMCPADYSRADCGDCLTAAAASSDGLVSLCPGSTTVLAMFERCLVRYSNVDFFGTSEIDIVQTFSGETLWTTPGGVYGPKVEQSLTQATAAAAISPYRFAAGAGTPSVFVQCTWDLSADKCKQCLDALSANATKLIAIRREGQRKSYSCTVRYSNSSFTVVPFTAASPPSSTPEAPPSSGSRTATVVGGAIAVFVVICLASLILYLYKFRGQRKAKEFFYRHLVFLEEEPLGSGAFGTVYKGKVKGVPEPVAIKKIAVVPKATTPQRLTQEEVKKYKEQVMKDFENEIEVMRPLHHRNIISLVGWCKDSSNLCLVYELMENGNLKDQLYPRGGVVMDSDHHGVTVPSAALLLEWKKRHSILIGIATGLEYLHCQCVKVQLHGDIKPSNVMLGKAFEAKLCDFGLVMQLSHEHASRSTDSCRGTPGYVDPAYVDTRTACAENDIYSFGIMLLEVVCCQQPDITQVGGRTVNKLVEKVREYDQKNTILGAADTRLRGPSVDEQLERVLMAGLLCVQEDMKDRPSIRDVLTWLKKPGLIQSLTTMNAQRSGTDQKEFKTSAALLQRSTASFKTAES